MEKKMTGWRKRQVVDMALEAGLAFDSEEFPEIWQTYMNVGREEIERFAELVRADERELCAKVCEENATDLSEGDWDSACINCADHIRARGQA
jgi:hypothetical protein